MRDKWILYGLSIFGFVAMIRALNKKPRKDWIIVFLLKTLMSGFIGNIIAGEKWLKFPVRLFPKAFKSSVLYDNLLFPLLCVYYNQTTYKSNLFGIVFQSFLYSIPITLFEVIIERKTDLITYSKWKWYYSLFSLSGTFIITRSIIDWIRYATRVEKEGSEHF